MLHVPRKAMVSARRGLVGANCYMYLEKPWCQPGGNSCLNKLGCSSKNLNNFKSLKVANLGVASALSDILAPLTMHV